MIGVFDSGVGGLTFLRELKKVLPEYDCMYLGDQLRVPYGGRSQEAIQQFTEECVSYLWAQGCELVILACNTACAESLRYLQQKYPDKKVLGVLIPAVEKAVEDLETIGVVATKGTITSNVYVKEVEKRGSGQMVVQKATPVLVPLIEENFGNRGECRKIIRNYVRPLKNAGVKKLILGCTHYPIIEKIFSAVMGAQVQIINPGREAAEKLLNYLGRHPEIDSSISRTGKDTFYTTDCPKTFENQAKQFYGKEVSAEKILVNV